MRIQIASDLHLEFPENRRWLEENKLIPSGEVLILAGDIVALKYKEKAQLFYDYVRPHFKQIISIFGNHEFYHGKIDFAYPTYLKKMAENHVLINNKIFVYQNVKFICSTLWSAIPDKDREEIENRMNDYHIIYQSKMEKIPITTDHTNFFNEISLKFIQEELKKEFKGKIVVVTHHLPSAQCNLKKYKNSSLNSAYVNDLDQLIKKNQHISAWIHGHSHEFNEIKMGKVVVARNPLGYVFEGEQHDFRRDYTIKV